jgi:hypothetical protein
VNRAEPPTLAFDLVPGDRFTPNRGRAHLTARWLPLLLPWRATATVTVFEPDRLCWEEENRLGPLRFRAWVELRLVEGRRARIGIRARLGPVALPTVARRYDVVAAEQDLLLLRSGRADMLSVGLQEGRVVRFHLRLPLGLAIHKSGELSRAAGGPPARRPPTR